MNASCPTCGGALETGQACPRCATAASPGAEPSPTLPSPVPVHDMATQKSPPREGMFRTVQAARGGVEPPPVKRIRGVELQEPIGKGGMGQVYRGRQVDLDRTVAVKILPVALSADAEFVERFKREAKALATLDHPNIVRVHDCGVEDGHTFLVMELVDGPNLREMLKKGLKPDEALALMPPICDALEYAHGQGVVHRDIKPENVLVDRQGHVKIADFGLAKMLNPVGERLTFTREVMGTPHYMSPEQVERPKEVDHRADIYALGVLLYEMLTGQLPIGRFEPPSVKSGLNARVDAIVFKALERDPARRYQRASELAADIRGLSTSPTVFPQLRLPSMTGWFRRQDRLRRRTIAEIAVAILLLAAVGYLALRPRTPTCVWKPATVRSVWACETGPSATGVSAGEKHLYVAHADRLIEVDAEGGRTMGEWRGTVAGAPVCADGRVVTWGTRDMQIFREGAFPFVPEHAVPLAGEAIAPPTIRRGTIYGGNGSRRAYAIDLETGKQIWESVELGISLAMPPAVFAGRVQFFTERGETQGVDTEKGVHRTGSGPAYLNGVPELCSGPPVACGDGWVVLRTRAGDGNRLVAYSAEGDLRSTIDLGADTMLMGFPAVPAHDRVLVTAENRILAVDLKTSRVAWSGEVGRLVCPGIPAGSESVALLERAALRWVRLSDGVGWRAPLAAPAGKISIVAVGERVCVLDHETGRLVCWELQRGGE